MPFFVVGSHSHLFFAIVYIIDAIKISTFRYINTGSISLIPELFMPSNGIKQKEINKMISL